MQNFGSRLLALGVSVAFALSAANAIADDHRDDRGGKGLITTKSIGTYGPADLSCAATGCVGAVKTCAVGEAISPINQTFYYVRNICDDRGANGLPACGERYVGYGEECSGAADGHQVGTVQSRATDGAFRICFSGSPLGQADCALPTPVAQVIAVGTTQSHTNHVLGTEILLGVGETIVERDSKWIADGKRRDWSRAVGKTNVIHTQAQINGGTCPETGPCGLSSTGVAASSDD